MSVAKETIIQQVRAARKNGWLLGLIGIPVGYAISYWFQPEFLRAKCSLGQYFVHFVDIIKAKETAQTAIVVTVIVATIFEVLGKWMTSRAKLSAASMLSDEEMRQAGIGGEDGRIVIGKIKEGEDTPVGSIKRIVKMLLIGIGIIILILILLVVSVAVFSGNGTR